MKNSKFVITSLLAVSLAGNALAAGPQIHAQASASQKGTNAAPANTVQYVHIVGAPAYRQNGNDTITAIVNSYAGAGLTATSASSATTAAVESAKQNQWLIPNFATGINLEVNITWSGSTAGLASVASGSITQKYIADNTGAVGTPTTAATVGTAIQPDFTLSDTFQATSVYNGTVKLQGPTSGVYFTKSYQALTDTELGVEPYRFVASPGAAAAGLTNITTSEAQLLYENGALPLAFFTGKVADQGTYVYALSRDPGSGSRLVALAETGVGPQTTIVTYDPAVTGGSLDSSGNYVGGTANFTNGAIPLYPHGLIPSTGVYDSNDGDTGYPSFGTTAVGTGLLQAVTATPPTGVIFVTYLNIDDSTEASNAGAQILTYNGVTYSAGSVQEGLYTFWSYEHLFNPTPLGTSVQNGYGINQASFASKIVAQFPTYAAVPLSGLDVTRSVDGGQVTQTY